MERSSGASRRDFLRLGGSAAAVLAAAPLLSSCVVPTPVDPPPTTLPSGGYGPLQPPDANGLRLPVGFTSRVIGTVGAVVGATGYVLPAAPDGGACFPVAGGGWTYVLNHEIDYGGGGVSAIEFDATGAVVAARSILTGTYRNCAGGATPWGTWLSCEEVSRGLVYECDPTGVQPAVVLPGMGAFQHEAVAVDQAGQVLYLTEDRTDGGLYRFTPTAYPDLSAGLLEVLTEVDGVLGWAEVPDPAGTVTSTRYQVATMKKFNGGEGIVMDAGLALFTTKGDNRVWAYDTAANTIGTVYDAATSPTPILTGVDNITMSSAGEMLVAEDGGDMQIVLIADGVVEAVVQITGSDPYLPYSEVTGPAFSPDGSRLYFSSQRFPGQTFEVTGPWRV